MYNYQTLKRSILLTSTPVKLVTATAFMYESGFGGDCRYNPITMPTPTPKVKPKTPVYILLLSPKNRKWVLNNLTLFRN